MKPETRAAVAAIGMAIVQKRKITSIYSYTDGKYHSIDAEVIENRVKAFDYSNSCHIDGNLPSNVYHYGNGSHLEFKVQGLKISGYDYDTGSHFDITVKGKDVEMYDYGDGHYHQFSV